MGSTLKREDVEIEFAAKEGFAAAGDRVGVVVLDTRIDAELLDRGLVNELVNRVQAARKELGLEYADRILVSIIGAERVKAVVTAFSESIAAEVLANDVSRRCPGARRIRPPHGRRWRTRSSRGRARGSERDREFLTVIRSGDAPLLWYGRGAGGPLADGGQQVVKVKRLRAETTARRVGPGPWGLATDASPRAKPLAKSGDRAESSGLRPVARAELLDKATRVRFESELDAALKRRPAAEAKLAGAVRAVAALSPALRASLGEATAVLIRRGARQRELYACGLRTLAEAQDRQAVALLRQALSGTRPAAPPRSAPHASRATPSSRRCSRRWRRAASRTWPSARSSRASRAVSPTAACSRSSRR